MPTVRVVAPHDGIASHSMRFGRPERLQAHTDAQIRPGLAQSTHECGLVNPDDLSSVRDAAFTARRLNLLVSPTSRTRTLQGFGRDDVHLRAQRWRAWVDRRSFHGGNPTPILVFHSNDC